MLNFAIIFLFICVFTGVSAILTRKNKGYAQKTILSLFLGNVILLVSGFLFMHFGKHLVNWQFVLAFMTVTLYMGPLLYLYNISVLNMWRRVPVIRLLHFAPVFVLFTVLCYSMRGNAGRDELTRAFMGLEDSALYTAYRFYLYVSLIAYTLVSVYISYIRAYKLRPRYPAQYWKNVRFSRKVVQTLFFILVCVLIFDILEFLRPEIFTGNLLTQIITSCSVLYIGFLAVKNRIGQPVGGFAPNGLSTRSGRNGVRKNDKAYGLITGASTGLGKSMAEEYARAGKNLLLVSLPGEDLKGFASSLSRRFGIAAKPFEIDLSGTDAPEDVAKSILGRYRVDTVVNNAGIGGSKKIEEVSLKDIDTIIQLNIRALSMLTCLFLEELKSHPSATIVNISSIAAFSPMPYKSVYPASKAFVYSFSRGLREELKGTSVKVIVANPGPILTNPDVCRRLEKQSKLARLFTHTPEKVANHIFEGIYMCRAVVIPGIGNHFNKLLLTWVPESLRLPILSRVWQTEAE